MVATVTSNGVEIPFDKEHFAPLRDSSDVAGDPAELRERYRADGYLYLPGFLEAHEARSMREAYFSLFDASYLKSGTTPERGVFSGNRPAGLPDHGVAGHPAYDFVRSDIFERFVSEPALLGLAESVLGGPAWRLPRSIVRHFDRSTPRASRAHVDHTYLDRGSDSLLTMWIPLGSCPLPTGGIVYLEGSHEMESEDFEPLKAVTDRPGDSRPITHDLSLVARKLGRRWLWADYSAGDVTVHSPHLVHASLDTVTEEMRLSADVRFLREGEPADPRWLQPWAGDDGN
ncbi:MAG TPA: phytanoyl-CoA dioxygenase family protein [Acidimicrobiales bacterium]|nr:phytanoyl-CoA dioxygenase family protein [Acidimicrobiales bacterium]